MENFFIRSMAHTPIDGEFLWSNGYVVRDKCVHKNGARLHTLSFSPTHFQVFERGFLLFEHTNLYVLDKHGCEELVGTFESQPLLISFSVEEYLLLVVLEGKCLLLNSCFELAGTLQTSSDVCSIEWNPYAHLIYCTTKDSLLILSSRLELLKKVCHSGPIALRSANLLAVASNGKVHFIERNGLEFGSPLVLSGPGDDVTSGEVPADLVSQIKFLDRSTLITVGRYLTLYSSKNNKWYKKIQQKAHGRFLGVTGNTLYFESKGIISIKVFKEFTKSMGMFFVVDGNSLFFYNYWESLVPPPLYDKVFELPGSIRDISISGDKIAILMSMHSDINRLEPKNSHLEESCFNDEENNHGSDGEDCALSLQVYSIGDFALEHSVDLSSLQGNILEILLLENAIWIRSEAHLYSVDASTSEVKTRMKACGFLKMYFFDRILLLDIAGGLHTVDEKCEIHDVHNLAGCCTEVEKEILYYDMCVYQDIYFVQINAKLVFGGLLIDGVVSFLVHRNILIVTKHDSIQFARLEDILLRRKAQNCEAQCLEAYILNDSLPQKCVNSSSCSEVSAADLPNLDKIVLHSESLIAERNSVILAYTSLLILYIPRGSIEAFSLRPIVVEDAKEHIKNGKYREAMDICTVNCISSDIWIGMEVDINRVAGSVKQSHLVALFTELLSLMKVGEQDTDHVLQFIVAKDIALKAGNLSLNSEHTDSAPKSQSHVPGHEKADVTVLSMSTDPLDVLGRLLYALNSSTLVEILIRVGLFPAALAISQNLESAVKAAICHTTPDNLIRQSLLLHDVDMSCRIALILDKRDYLHELQRIRGGDEKLKIFDYLRMYEKALDYLFEKHIYGGKRTSETHRGIGDGSGPAEETDLAQVLAYIEEHDLYEYSMKYNHPKFIEAYAEKLLKNGNYEKSFVLYRDVNLEKALDVSFFLESKCSIDVASELGILNTEFYKKLVESLASRNRWEEAALLQRDVIEENAMSYFLRANNMLESLVEFAKYVGVHRRSEKCICPEKDVLFDLDRQGKNTSVAGILSIYGHLLFGSNCIQNDLHYREFVAKIKEIERRENEALDRKARQVDRCVQKMRRIKDESCGASDTTFSYTVSGKTVKMSEEEFVQKRLSALKEEACNLKTNEIAEILDKIGVVSDIRAKHSRIMESVQDAVDMAALLV